MQTETLNNLAVAEVLQNGFASHIRTHAEHLAKDYTIKNPQEIADFIGENLFLLSLLEEIPPQIRKYFGKEQKLALKVSSEPDFPQSRDIWVLILTKLPVKKAFAQLEKFDEKWWFNASDKSNFKLNIRLDYIK